MSYFSPIKSDLNGKKKFCDKMMKKKKTFQIHNILKNL